MLLVQGPAPKGSSVFRLAPPAAPKYPPGARLLKGANHSYVLLPLGQLIDECYTAYFNFVAPKQAEGAKAVAGQGGVVGAGGGFLLGRAAASVVE